MKSVPEFIAELNNLIDEINGIVTNSLDINITLRRILIHAKELKISLQVWDLETSKGIAMFSETLTQAIGFCFNTLTILESQGSTIPKQLGDFKVIICELIDLADERVERQLKFLGL